MHTCAIYLEVKMTNYFASNSYQHSLEHLKVHEVNLHQILVIFVIHGEYFKK